MGKQLIMVLCDEEKTESVIEIDHSDTNSLNISDCEHIVASVDDEFPTETTVMQAIHTLVNYFYATGDVARIIDVNKLNRKLAPPTEMTVAEIEKELGYKVKIVKEKEK